MDASTQGSLWAVVVREGANSTISTHAWAMLESGIGRIEIMAME
jgi:hypothetical protein